MPSIGPMELVVVLVLALLVLGPKRLPEAGRSIGKGLREFKDSIGGKDTTPEIERNFTSEPADLVARQTAAPQPVEQPHA